jgi:hypothetical protein
MVEEKDLPSGKSLIGLWSLDYKVTEQHIYSRIATGAG